jgi:hypothetical protein
MTGYITDLLTAALAAAARGWPVFPLRPGSKRPALHGADRCLGSGPCANGHRGWEQRATTEPAVIERCWSTAPYNVGLATGPAGLVIVDLDMASSGEQPPAELAALGVANGVDMLVLLADRAGKAPPLDTYTVSTPSGGQHLYFAAPADVELRNTSGDKGRGLGWCIDTRAHGGYVVLAGSIVDGRQYEVTDDCDPTPLPAWLIERLRPAPLPPQRPVVVPLVTDRRTAFLRAAVDGELGRVTSSPPRGHNIALYHASVALGQLVAGGALDEADVVSWLVDAAAKVGQKPGETHRTIRSGLRAGAKRPRSIAA